MRKSSGTGRWRTRTARQKRMRNFACRASPIPSPVSRPNIQKLRPRSKSSSTPLSRKWQAGKARDQPWTLSALRDACPGYPLPCAASRGKDDCLGGIVGGNCSWRNPEEIPRGTISVNNCSGVEEIDDTQTTFFALFCYRSRTDRIRVVV